MLDGEQYFDVTVLRVVANHRTGTCLVFCCLSKARRSERETDRLMTDYVINHMTQRGRVLEKPTVLQLAKSSMNFWDLKFRYHGHNSPPLSLC